MRQICPYCQGTKFHTYYCSWTQDIDVDFCETCQGTGFIEIKETAKDEVL